MNENRFAFKGMGQRSRHVARQNAPPNGHAAKRSEKPSAPASGPNGLSVAGNAPVAGAPARNRRRRTKNACVSSACSSKARSRSNRPMNSSPRWKAGDNEQWTMNNER